jgi:hypothetical protein
MESYIFVHIREGEPPTVGLQSLQEVYQPPTNYSVYLTF